VDRLEQISEKVVKGEVLDEHWGWVPVLQQIAKEKEFIEHLEAGNVLHKGKWVSISEAKQLEAEALKRKKEAEAHSSEIQLSANEGKFYTAEGDLIPPPPETVLINEDMLRASAEMRVTGLSTSIDRLGLPESMLNKEKTRKKIIYAIAGSVLFIGAAATGLFFLYYHMLHQW
jgi:hypothetical protein